MLSEAVGFVADVLEELEAEVVALDADGVADAVDVDEFFFFGEGDDLCGFVVHGFEDVHGGVELADAAVDKDQIGEKLVAGGGLAIPAGDDFLDGEEIVVALAMLDAIAAIAVFEGNAINETDERADHFASLQMGDIDAFDDARRLGEIEGRLKLGDPFARVADEGFMLPEFFGAFAGPLAEGLERFDLIAQSGGAFEVEISRGFVHLFFEVAKDAFAVAVEEAVEIADIFGISIARNLGGAGGGALFDCVEQTGTKEAALVVGFADLKMTGAEFEGLLEMGNGLFELIDAGEGAEELDAFGAGCAGDVYAWEFVAGGDHEIGIGFAIDQAGVVFGVEVFDEAVFGEEGFDFGIGMKDVEIDDIGEEAGFAEFQRGGGKEVGGDAIAEAGGFADVNDAAFVVLHEVDAGGFGEGAGFFEELGEAVGHGCLGEWYAD